MKLMIACSTDAPVAIRCPGLQQQGPYFDPTYTRTGWIGQPPVLDRHEVVTIDGELLCPGYGAPGDGRSALAM